MNIGDWISRRSNLHPEKEAIVFGELRVTYQEFSSRINRLSHALVKMGLDKGDRLAIYSLNSPAFLEMAFACARVGVIVVPINFRLTPVEIEYVLNDSGARVLMVDTNLFKVIEELIGRLDTEHVIIEGGEAPGSTFAYASLLEDQPADAPFPADPAGDDDAFSLMYTSGTTGKAKGAILTHNNVFWNAVNCVHGFQLGLRTRFLQSVPLFHAGGLNGGAIPVFYAGGTIVLQAFFNPETTMGLVEQERITFLGGVPVMFQMLLDQPDFDTGDMSSVETIMGGAMPVPVALIEAYQKKNVTFQQSYGLTEACSSVLSLRHEDAIRKVGSAGKPFFHVDVRVVGGDGTEVKPGEVGEIQVRGGNVMKGYWNRPQETAAVLEDGWLHTGDMATVDEEGYVFIKDRKKDLIISGGENIYPAEVEEALCRHPQIDEAGVIGVPDPKWGEAVRAIIVPVSGEEPTLEGIIDFCQTRLAGYKLPKSVVLVNELPKTALGKLQHKELRDQYGQ